MEAVGPRWRRAPRLPPRPDAASAADAAGEDDGHHPDECDRQPPATITPAADTEHFVGSSRNESEWLPARATPQYAVVSVTFWPLSASYSFFAPSGASRCRSSSEWSSGCWS
jgi:hypothetical protein